VVFLWIIRLSTISPSASFKHGITDHIRADMRRSNVTPPPPNKLIAFIPKTGDVGWPDAAHVLEDSTPVGVVVFDNLKLVVFAHGDID
jgi:hypothetical protein